MTKGIVWFKNDLRLRDHEALYRASSSVDVVYPLYIFDPRNYRELDLGFRKAGPFKTRFLLECVACLRMELRERGAELIVRIGYPEEIIPELAFQVGAVSVFTAKETGSEESQVLKSLEEVLLQRKIDLKTYWMHTLLHEEDVPWPIRQVPEVFSTFRKEAEKAVEVRQEFDPPGSLHVITDIEGGQIPTIEELGLEPTAPDSKVVMNFKGGEHEGIKRLNYYLWESDQIQNYKNTRNGLLGKDFSSKLSPWLASGAISPRTIYHELRKYESQRKKNSSTYWLFFELLWRDFFRFMSKKHGSRIFQPSGFQKTDSPFSDDMQRFEQWKSAKTGEPFVDANMTELNLTGYMSNRGRQIVASYLMHDLGVNWTWGAAWFENRLLDYDMSSNWLNWAYIAGVGNDPRNGRKFNIESQQQRYDPKGDYIRFWLQSFPVIQ